MQEWTPLYRKTRILKRGANEQNHYAVAIVKKTTGCTENQGSWLRGNWQHVCLVSKVELPNV